MKYRETTGSETKRQLSPYLDGAVSGGQMRNIQEHLAACFQCSTYYLHLRQTQTLVSGLGKVQAPPELAMRLRLAISREAARPSRWESLRLSIDYAVHAFMVPATAGVFSAVLFFGLLIGFFALPGNVQASNDVPTMLYTPPRLQSSPFEVEVGGAGKIVVEAWIDANGRVEDYRILSAPEDVNELLPALNNALIFTRFQPATSFGQPTSSRAILSFEKVNVKG